MRKIIIVIVTIMVIAVGIGYSVKLNNQAIADTINKTQNIDEFEALINKKTDDTMKNEKFMIEMRVMAKNRVIGSIITKLEIIQANNK